MRGSVVATDFVLFLAAWLYLSTTQQSKAQQLSTLCLVVGNCGLLFVDHIHFQYNGVMLGLLVLCLYFAATGKHLFHAATFSCLVLMKHLFVPLAPVFAVYLLVNHCVVSAPPAAGHNPIAFGAINSRRKFSLWKFMQLAAIACTALALAFGPFLIQKNGAEQISQIISRLFPFGRGLVHAYWAPNVWALYCMCDKLLFFAAKKLNNESLNALLMRMFQFGAHEASGHNSAAGLVGDFTFAVLPRITPGVCMGLLALALVPALYVMYTKPTPKSLIHCLVFASLSSFMVGYHVHEKAVIIPLLLQTLLLFAQPHATTTSSSSSSSFASSASPTANTTPTISPAPASSWSSPSSSSAAVAATAAFGGAAAPIPASSSDDPMDTGVPVPGVVRVTQPQLLQLRVAQSLFALMAIAGTYSLFPLFFTIPEVMTKSKSCCSCALAHCVLLN
jgi:hypothetical protein